MGNLSREIESLLISASNNAIRTNYVKAKIGKSQKNSKCRLYSDRDETISHIISECYKLAQKEYESRHDWVVKVIYWELCKLFKFDNTTKWYMLNPESVLENEMHKILLAFEIQTDHLISTRNPDIAIAGKTTTKKKKHTQKHTKKTKPTKLWILSSLQTTELKWKKAKRKISFWALREN